MCGFHPARYELVDFSQCDIGGAKGTVGSKLENRAVCEKKRKQLKTCAIATTASGTCLTVRAMGPV